MITLLSNVVMIVRRLSHLIAELHPSCRARPMYVLLPMILAGFVDYALLPNHLEVYYTFFTDFLHETLVLPNPHCTLFTYSSSSHNNVRPTTYLMSLYPHSGRIINIYLHLHRVVIIELQCWEIRGEDSSRALRHFAVQLARKDPAVRHSLDAAKSSLEIALCPSATPSVHVRDV